ncbi:phage tail protein [Tsukamurella conjunctivitidis]|uniref:Phage tail protein n=1 Tax=Tsukamurella conjunctivitidis TaxID=2592068 RepID=A0A5C5RXR2_9ACTN|nr:phage tail protein [Tsukamurella conjunctivitidis]TWS27268.1 phage tail protein [Tsukamurella conjunctivitidis]
MSMPVAGAPFHIKDWLNTMHIFGVFSDGDTPGVATATFEGIDDDLVVTVPVMKGDKGDDGMPSPVVVLQRDYTAVPTPADLPQTLTEADAGKAWWFPGTAEAYVWFGDRYLTRPLGAEGRPGPVPQLSFSIERKAPGTGTTITQTGSAAAPHLHIAVDPPAGPQGPASAISLASDYNDALPPDNGQVLTWNQALNSGNGLWEPSDFASMHPMFFSIPENAFTNMSSIISGRMTILSFAMPALDYAWVPHITGHFKAIGIDLNILDPFKIGAEVRIGDPMNGTLVARGVGNIAQECTVTPHFSSPGDPGVSVSPDNGVAQIAAGVATTINVNLVNDGLIGLYSFNRQNAQLAVLCIPQGA